MKTAAMKERVLAVLTFPAFSLILFANFVQVILIRLVAWLHQTPECVVHDHVVVAYAKLPQPPQNSQGEVKPWTAEDAAMRVLLPFLDRLEACDEEVVDEIREFMEATEIGKGVAECRRSFGDHDYAVRQPDWEENMRRICNIAVRMPSDKTPQLVHIFLQKVASIEARRLWEARHEQRL